jgi:hypothetical protein
MQYQGSNGHSATSDDVTARLVGKQTGLTRGEITCYLSRSLEKALIIHSSDKKDTSSLGQINIELSIPKKKEMP